MTERPNCDPISQRCYIAWLVSQFWLSCISLLALPCGMQLLCFCLDFSSDPQKQVPANNFNLPHKNTAKETISVQLQLVSFVQRQSSIQWNEYWFYIAYRSIVWKYVDQCWILFPSRKTQSVLIAKISSHKTQQIVNPQKYTRAKISCHTVVFRPFESTVAHCKYDF